MKKPILILLAVLIGFGILVVGAGIMIGVYIGRASVPSDSCLVVSFANRVKERSPDLVLAPRAAFHDVLAGVRRAASDVHIQEVLVYGDSLPMSMAQREEIRDALAAVVKAGKPVIIHFNSISIGDYYVVPKGAKVVIHETPGAYVSLAGYYAPQMFMRELLEDRLGIKMNVVHIGEYKGAGEPFTRDSMSRYLREELTSFLDDVWNNFIDTIPDVRGISASRFRERLYNGAYFFLTPKQAKESKLVDEFGYRMDLEGAYDHTVSATRYADTHGYESSSAPIALILAEGEIVMGTGSDNPFAEQNQIAATRISRIIRRAADDSDVKAIVFRINSPGGSALASELIYQELKRAARKKPVIASIGGMGASGGYYIACGCDTIFADRASLVGSIGVVALIPELTKLMNKVGLHVDPVKKGKYADFLTPYEPMRPEHESMLRQAMLDTYAVFKDRVVRARHLSPDRVEALAKGRIYSGRRGHELGLVDQIGGLYEALQEAARRAGLDAIEYRVMSPRVSWLQKLSGAQFALKQPGVSLKRLQKELVRCPVDTPLLLAPVLAVEPEVLP